LARQLSPDNGKGAAQPVKSGPENSDLEQLIERADIAADRREKTLLARARAGLPRVKADALTLAAADPSRPSKLRSFDGAEGAVLLPVSGTITLPLDKSENSKPEGPALSVT